MFIKLTRLDNNNTPIWLNANFVVTVEPRKGGGSIVVPIGDGLDYEVRENPELVLDMLGDAPVPALVPVPVSDGLAPTPPDVSTEPEHAAAEVEPPIAIAKASKAAEPLADAASPEEASVEKPARKPRAKSAAKKPRAPRKAKTPKPMISAEQMERLRKMAPGSLRKLQNTLVTQFKIEDPESEVKALEATGMFKLDRDHVCW